jgi:flagellar biosynthetic protein FliR
MVSMIALAPIFGSGMVPVQAKIGLGFLISFIIFPIVSRDFPPIPPDLVMFAGLIIKEFLVGALLGLVGAVIFAAVQISGQIFGMQIGFGIVNVIDPLSDLQISVLGQFEFIVAILLFIAVGGHQLLILAITNSYTYIPMGAFHMSSALNDQITGILDKMFVVGYKVGFTMISRIFIINAMGIIARTVPQMNIFIVGLPLNIFVGLTIMGVSIAFVAFVLRGYFDQVFIDIVTMFRVAGGT